jgi:acetoacetyl-CoA synthetase
MSDGAERPLWTPSPERIAGSRMHQLVGRAGVADSRALHRWSVDEPDAFWDLVWDDTGVIGERGESPAFDGRRFFADARLSYAENLLGHAPDPAAPAVVDVDEAGNERITSWAVLTATVAAAADALRHDGVGVGDRVAAWLPNVTETIVVALAASAVGATFTSTSPDFGVDGVIDRFGQVDPVVLVATDGSRYGGSEFGLTDRATEVARRLPTLRRVVVVPGSLATPVAGSHLLARLAHPATGAPNPGTSTCRSTIRCSCSTRRAPPGVPKCIVHRAGGVLLMHLKEHQYHCDIKPNDRLLYFTTCGWMMWNWLALGARLGQPRSCCYDGSRSTPTQTSCSTWPTKTSEISLPRGVGEVHRRLPQGGHLAPARPTGSGRCAK